MSARYRDLLDLAETSHQAGREQHDSDLQASAANSFRAAARFYRAALAELDPTIAETI